MKKMKLKIIILICVVITAFFSLGLDKQQPLEEMNVISGVGVDLDVRSNIPYHIVPFSVYLLEPPDKMESGLRPGTALTYGGTRQTRQLIDDRQSLLGLEKVLIISESQAVYGLKDLLDILLRNTHLNGTAFVVVCKGKAADMLDKKIKGYASSSDFIAGLIRNTVYYNFFSAEYKVNDLIFTVDSEGRNLVVPYIEVTEEGEGIKVTGMALFKKEKMVEKIDVDELRIMNIMRENNVLGTLSIWKGPTDYIDYYATSKRKISCTKKGDKYKFTININLKGDLVTDTLYKDLQEDPAKNAKFNKEMAEDVKKRCDDFISKMQNEYKVDCLQLGQIAVSKYGRHSGVDWNSIVCNSEIEVNVKVKIEKTGRGDY